MEKLSISIILILSLSLFSCNSQKQSSIKPEISILKTDNSEKKIIYPSFGPYLCYSDSGLKQITLTYFSSNKQSDRAGIYLEKTNLIISDSEPVNCHRFIYNPRGGRSDYRIESEDPHFNGKYGGILIPENTPFLFAVYGDSRSNYGLHEEVCNSIAGFRPLFVIHTGDMVDDGNKLEQWPLFFKSAESIITNAVIVPVRGNHDGGLEVFTNIFRNPGNKSYYSIDFPEAKLIVLDTESDFDNNSEQYLWLTNELAGVQDKWKFVAFHRPPFSSSVHQSDNDADKLRNTIAPAMQKYHVNLVLNGHDHLYERYEKNNVMYITTGGGGAPFYPITGENEGRIKIITNQLNFLIIEVTGKKVSVKVFNKEKEELDGFDMIE